MLVLAFQQFASGASLPSQDSKYSKGSQDDFLHAVFPSDFKWGVGSSAFQVEGGYQDDGEWLSFEEKWRTMVKIFVNYSREGRKYLGQVYSE